MMNRANEGAGYACGVLTQEYRWIDIDGPVTQGWWALERAGERLALLQPFRGRVAIVFYLGAQPWAQKHGSAGTMAQAKRFAERWIAPRLRQEIPTAQAGVHR